MRMPIGVPVVLPSNTPESSLTWSVSRRWLTKCEVPVRRRSTSACKSASLKASPGGQPSTTPPMTGPWLSPKVVTAKSLPIVLPGMQLLRRQQKHSAAAALELKPRQRQLRKRPPHSDFSIARLDDQDAARPKMARRIAQYNPNRIQSRTPGSQGDPRFVPVLGGQRAKLACADIRRVTHDDIVALVAERAEMIGFDEAHAPGQVMLTHVNERDGERLRADIERIDARARKGECAGDRDAARTGSDIEHAPHARRRDPRRKTAFDEFRQGRARNEYARIDMEFEAREARAPDEIGRRDALADAPFDERLHRLAPARAYAARIAACRGGIRQLQRVPYQRGRFIGGVVGSVAEENRSASQTPRARCDERAHRDAARAVR